MMEYSHILNIKLSDLDNNLIENDEIMKIIKTEIIDKYITQNIFICLKNIECILKWKHLELRKPYNNFIGDLCVNSPYRHDTLIFEHTKQTLENIEKDIKENKEEHKEDYGVNWKIVFDISRPMCDPVQLEDEIRFL